MSRNKGKRGERLIIDWLQPIVDKVYTEFSMKPVLLQRNTVQSDVGGSDICGLHWLAAEVKNCEAQGPQALHDWWKQCNEQYMEGQTPILFYTRARAPIRIRMMGHVGYHSYNIEALDDPHDVDAGVAALVDISEADFEKYFEARLRSELGKKLLSKAVRPR